MNKKVQNGTVFYKQVLEFHRPSKFLCHKSGRQNHWSLVTAFLFPSFQASFTFALVCFSSFSISNSVDPHAKFKSHGSLTDRAKLATTEKFYFKIKDQNVSR
jgi:hypothetical protein